VPLHPGSRIGAYEVLALLGKGAYDVAVDDRFLVSVPLTAPQANSIAVIVNWGATVKS